MEIQSILEKMKVTLLNTDGGVGLAAPQVGISKRIILVRPIHKEGDNVIVGDIKVYINPLITNLSKEKATMVEECLSLPNCEVPVTRPLSFHIKALNEKSEFISEDLTGFNAREVLHENDHIDGIMIIDYFPTQAQKKQCEEIIQSLLPLS